MKTCSYGNSSKSALLLMLMVMLMGCPNKNSNTDPGPQADLVGTWEMVSFIVSPPIQNGIADLLAYQRQLLQFNCSALNFYVELKANGTLRSWSESKCMSGTLIDEDDEFTNWSINGNKLILSNSSGGQQEFTYSYKQGTAGKTDTQLTLRWDISGSTYTATYNKN